MSNKATTKKPSHQAYIVVERSNGRKPYWVQIGSIWPHKNGTGFDLAIPAGLSLTGRIVCMPEKPDDDGSSIDT